MLPLEQGDASMRSLFLSSVITLVALPTLAESNAPQEVVARGTEMGRVRWGVHAKMGAFLSQPTVVAAAVGAEGMIGYQMNRVVALYGNAGAAGGLGFSNGTASAVNAFHFGALGEFTLFDRLSLAVGPVLARSAWGSSSGTGASETLTVASGFMPGGQAKIGYQFGARNPVTGRRSGFHLGLDLLVLFATSPQSQSSGPGTAVGFAPTLTLGYDAR
jgi:hypothetical protein